MHSHVDPIEILVKEHNEGLKRLAELSNAAEYIDRHGFAFEAYTQIAGAIRFINSEIRNHNEKEEKYLFPLIERHVHGPAHAMHNEHRELWRLFSRLLESVEDVEEGRIYATTIKELVLSSRLIVDLLTEHIRKENNVLFPMAKQVLTNDEYEQLSQNIARESLTIPKD